MKYWTWPTNDERGKAKSVRLILRQQTNFINVQSVAKRNPWKYLLTIVCNIALTIHRLEHWLSWKFCKLKPILNWSWFHLLGNNSNIDGNLNLVYTPLKVISVFPDFQLKKKVAFNKIITCSVVNLLTIEKFVSKSVSFRNYN